jgi:hypothetical protein
MKTLVKPTITHREILETCTSNIDNADLRIRIQRELNFFDNSSKEYDEKGILGELSQIPIEDNVNGVITKQEMKFLYSKLVAKGQPARDYYDRILHNSKVCPVCGFGKSRTLDHYLPKAIFPAYAVDPLNLIPCCRDCNFEKRSDIPEKGKETLHPYYDVINDERWLYTEIGEDERLAFVYKVRKPQNWENDKFIKLKYHFEVFDLSDLYSTLASQEINDQAYFLNKLFAIGGPEVVKEQLIEFHISAQKQDINHWKSAMYEALAYNEWFCTTGIQSLAV